MGRLAQAGPFPFDAMFACRKATEADIPLIRSLAGVAFPATYRELLSPAQLDYMMEWMYSEQSLRKQLRGGHVFYIASCDGEPCGYVSVERQGERLFHLQKIYVLPRFQGVRRRGLPLPHGGGACPGYAAGGLPHGAEREPGQPGAPLLRAHGDALSARGRLPDRQRFLHERLYHGARPRVRSRMRPSARTRPHRRLSPRMQSLCNRGEFRCCPLAGVGFGAISPPRT